MMKKDETIFKIIETLKVEINFSQVEIVDHWEGDLCAIGIKKEKKLVYISTYNFSEINPIKYDYDLEELDAFDISKFKTLKQNRGVSENDLIAEIKSFLGVE